MNEDDTEARVAALLQKHAQQWGGGSVVAWACATVEDVAQGLELRKQGGDLPVSLANAFLAKFVSGSAQAAARAAGYDGWEPSIRSNVQLRRDDCEYGRFEIVCTEWHAQAERRMADDGQSSSFTSWQKVSAQTFPAFWVDSMIQSRDGTEAGTPAFVDRDDVQAAAGTLLGPAGAEPVCLVAADVGMPHKDALDFDKVFVAVGDKFVCGVWLYVERLFG